MAAVKKNYNLYELQNAYSNSVSGALQISNPKADQAGRTQQTRDIITGCFTKAAAEMCSSPLMITQISLLAGGAFLGEFVTLTDNMVVRAPIPGGFLIPMAVIGVAAFVVATEASLKVNAARYAVSRQYDEDFRLNANAVGNRKIYRLAEKKIINYVTGKMNNSTPGL